jgi:hypothetical protein
MTSELDDIRKELRGYRNELDEANIFLSKEYHWQNDDRKSANRTFVVHNKVMKEVFFHLERLFRIAEAHRLQMTALYESIMSLPEVQADEKLREKIRERFQEVKDKQS